MGEFLPSLPITPTGGAVGLFFVALLAVLGFMLKRLDKGPTEIQTGYSALVKDLQASSAAYQQRARRAERKAELQYRYRVRAEDYASELETRLGEPHKVWEYEDEDDE